MGEPCKCLIQNFDWISRAISHNAAANDHAATHMSAHPRLSLGLDTDGSDSEPDVSALALARAAAEFEDHNEDDPFDDEMMSQGQYEADDTSVEDQVVENVVEHVDSDEEQEEEEEVVPLVDPATIGLKEISNLGKFTVSSHKQGNGVEELRSDDLKLYWQYVPPRISPIMRRSADTAH